MRLAHYLWKRPDGTYIFRFVLPEDVRPAFGRREIRKVLPFRDETALRYNCLLFALQIKRAIRDARMAIKLDSRFVFPYTLKFDGKGRLTEATSEPGNQKDHQQLMEHVGSILEKERERDALRRSEDLDAPILAELDQGHRGVTDAKGYTTGGAKIVLSQVRDHYLVGNKELRGSSIKAARSAFNKAISILGDVDVTTEHQGFTDLHVEFGKIPLHWLTKPEYKKRNPVTQELEPMNLVEAQKVAMEHGLPTLADQTVRRDLGLIAAGFAYAVDTKLLKPHQAALDYKAINVSIGRKRISRATDKLDEDESVAFPISALQKIFDARTYGKTPNRPSSFWVPIICLFTAMRREECSGIRTEQIVLVPATAEGPALWAFDFRKSAVGRSVSVTANEHIVKTESSRRWIPVPQPLVELGFLEYVDAIRQKGHQRIFPELNYDKSEGYGRGPGRAFITYLEKLKIHERGDGLHRLRKNALDGLQKENVRDEVRYEIAGHAIDTIQRRHYVNSSPLPMRKDALDRLRNLINYAELAPAALATINVIRIGAPRSTGGRKVRATKR